MRLIVACLCVLWLLSPICFAQLNTKLEPQGFKQNPQDARNKQVDTDAAEVPNEDFTPYGIYAQTAPVAGQVAPQETSLPLGLESGQRIALIGNTLFDRGQQFGHFEAMLQQRFSQLGISVRGLAWSGDEVANQPRPANFASTEQHLTHEKADVILAAFGFNESFAGTGGVDAFRAQLTTYLEQLKTRAFNGRTAARIVLVSPTANENIAGTPAADLNNRRLQVYVAAMKDVAQQQGVGFADVFTPTVELMQDPDADLTINGVHLNADGYQAFSGLLFKAVFGIEPPAVDDDLLAAVVEKNRQYFRRFRPLNTFYYTGGRNKSYGYLDFLPAMRNFDMLVDNRQQHIWDLAQGNTAAAVDDSNVPELPGTLVQRGANRWMSAEDELASFQIDDRFEVNLFAGEEEFPEIAAPIQMRWDNRGRLWVSCSTTYPHVYPGNEPNDKLVILEDTDGDGRADKSTVFADDLQIPLSFEFGDGGVYVSEMPHLTFLEDTDGDDRCDQRTQLLTGFGTEDSHHALHDFAWTPDGDLIFRESVFHHSQVETAYGPVRQQNSGWFRFSPQSGRLISFGTYSSTNPWGVTFDDWGQHVASHPVYAAAFHALDPPYPTQHPRPSGLQAYSGVCGHEFVDFATFPDELRGGFIKVRYKPTNRIEMHKWVEKDFGFEEEYVGDLLFSSNLSFIPVDLRFGPRGAMYVCDWYNPIKGHAQYSLRDDRRDRHSGRIWRITTKGKPVQDPPEIADASIDALLDLLKRPEYRIRFWAKRELRERSAEEVGHKLAAWTQQLDTADPRYLHHLTEALWTIRWIGEADLRFTALPEVASDSTQWQPESNHRTQLAVELLQGLLSQDQNHHARAAATQQLRYWHQYLPNLKPLLQRAANDQSAIVRMEAAIAASYIGTQDALECALEVLKHPLGEHLEYAVTCALGSQALKRHWDDKPEYGVALKLSELARSAAIKEPTPSASQAAFDTQETLKRIDVECIPERMLFSQAQMTATLGQPLKIVFTNPDATDHNLVFVQPDSLAEVGMAANEMARDPRNANSDFIPREMSAQILVASKMIGPTRAARIDVLRFNAPTEPGIYPYVCTFPGHWVVMNGVLAVGETQEHAQELLESNRPQVVRDWAMLDFNDFESVSREADEATVVRGMQASVKANCQQCHVIGGHGLNLGPDLAESVKKLRGIELLRQIIEPSAAIHEKFKTEKFLTIDGRIVAGVVVNEDENQVQVATNLLTPNTLTTIPKADIEQRVVSTTSAMPEDLVNVLTRQEILDLITYLESPGYQLPEHLQHSHGHGHMKK